MVFWDTLYIFKTSAAGLIIVNSTENQNQILKSWQKVTYSNFSNLSNFYVIVSTTVLIFVSETFHFRCYFF